jgi:chemotaxis protein CheD
MNISQVEMDSFNIKDKSFILKASGIGSCVVVVLHNIPKKIGALLHISSFSDIINLEHNYNGAVMVENVLRKMEIQGCLHSFTQVSIIGGANMFLFDINKEQDVGLMNVENARNYFKKLNFNVVNENILGKNSRSVTYEILTGAIEIVINT